MRKAKVPGTKSRELAIALSLCLLALALLLGHLLFDSAAALLFRDNGSFTLPAKYVWVESLRRFGELAFWNPFPLCGAAFLADPSHAAYFPLNALLLPFGSLTYGFSWYLAAHFPLAFLGFWLYARERGLAAAQACLLAMLAAFPGAVVSSLYFTGGLGAWVAVGWLLWAWRRFQLKNHPAWLFFASFCLAWPIFSGDPQVALLLALFFLPFATTGSVIARAAKLGLLAALTGLAAAPVILPTFDLLPDTVRGGGLEHLETYSLHPLRLIEFFFRLPFGPSLLEESAVGSLVNAPDPIPFLISLYPGVLFLPLLAAALRRNRESLVWLAVAAVLLVIALGSFSPLPLNRWLGEALPPWRSFRYPERLFLFVTLALWLTLLSSLAGKELNLRRFSIALASVAAVAALCLLAGFPSSASLGGHSLLVLAAAGAAAALTRKAARRSYLPWALALLCAADLGLGLRPIVWAAPAKVATAEWQPFRRLVPESPSLENIPRIRNLNEGDLNRELLSRLLPEGSMPQKLSVHQFLALQNNTGSLSGLGSPLGFVTMLGRRHVAFWAALTDQEKAYSLKGTKYIGRASENDTSVAENKSALPLFSVPTGARFAAGDEEALRLIASPDFPWRKEIVITGAAAPGGSISGAASVRVLRRTYREVELELTAPAALESYLFWNETFSKHWKLELGSGEALKPMPANHWAMAFPLKLSAGTQRLLLRYSNPWITAGQALFVLWLGLFGAFGLRVRFGKMKKQRE